MYYWSTEEDSSISFDDDVLVSHGGHVGSSSCAATKNHRNLRDVEGRHIGHVVENPTEVAFSWEDIALARQVGPS